MIYLNEHMMTFTRKLRKIKNRNNFFSLRSISINTVIQLFSYFQLEESSSKEVERVKMLHGKQSAELADQLERMRQEKREMERDSLKQKAELKGETGKHFVVL